MAQHTTGNPAVEARSSSSRSQPSVLQASPGESQPATPFLYNMRVLPVALPGALFVLTMAGELLLAILTAGALIIYLMTSGGAHQNAIVAYICTFVAAQLAVLYSCLPLIWISLFNVPLLMVLNVFLGLTGGWGLVQFHFFTQDQPLLAQTIETGLFTLYPLTSVGLVTWLTGYVVSVRFAVYFGIIYGFLLLRTSLKPTRSSFSPPRPQQTQTNLILGNAEVAAVLIVYLGFPCVVFFLSHLMTFVQGDFSVLVELVLVTILPTFLTTFIQLRGMYEQCNITVRLVSNVRTALGLLALVIGWWILHQSGLSAATAWLPPAILFYTLLGFSLSRGRKAGGVSISFAVCAGLTTIYVISQVVPTTINVPFVSSHLISCALVVNVVVSILCAIVLGNSPTHSSYFPQFFLLHYLIFVHTECFLMSHGIYSHYLALFTTLTEIYLSEQLRAATRVSRNCQWLACSMHAMKLPLFVEYALQVSDDVISFRVLSCYSCVALALVLTKVVLLEDRKDLQPSSAAGYLLCVCTGLFVFLVNVVRPLLLQFVDTVGMVQVVLVDVFLTSLISCKLTLCNMQQYPYSFLLSGVLLSFSGCSFVLQTPVVRGLVSPWLIVMLESAVVVHLSCTCSLLKVPHPRLYALVEGVLIGVPLGVTFCQFFVLAPSALAYAMHVLLSVETITILLLLWRYSIEWKTRNLVLCTRDYMMHGTFVAFVGVSLCLLARDVALLSKSFPRWDVLSSSPTVVFVCLLYCSVGVGVHLFCLKWQQQDPFSYKPGLLPTYGNVATIAAYLLAVLSNPLPFPEIWNSASSIVLLCLQQDRRLLPDFRAAMRTSIIFSVCSLQLFLFSLRHSILWTRWSLGLFAILELLALPLSGPSLVVMAKVLSRPPNYLLPEHTVILWAPLPIVIFILGGSYTSWLLAGTSFVSGMWLLHKTSFAMQV